MTLDDLSQMSEMEINEAERTALGDIRDVQINPELPWIRRAESYLAQIRNPYCFLCGGSIVRVRFNDGGADLQSRLKSYFISLKKS